MPSGYPGTRGQEQSNMVGQKFGRLLALNYNVKVSKQKRCDCYSCQCDCGIERVVNVTKFVNDVAKLKKRTVKNFQRIILMAMNIITTQKTVRCFVLNVME